MEETYLKSCIKQLEYYKSIGEKAMLQIEDEHLFVCYNEECNSIATIVKHLYGNMLSRWTDFLTTDGEKEWRERDAEFTNDLHSREELMKFWDTGWGVVFEALNSLKSDDLMKIVYIRGEQHTVIDAINRQLAHYPYHIGQIIFISKMFSTKWKTLTIARGGSKKFNEEMPGFKTKKP